MKTLLCFVCLIATLFPPKSAAILFDEKTDAGPSSIFSRQQCAIVDSFFDTPLHQGLGFSESCNVDIGSAIVGLRPTVSPNTVLLRVSLVVVFSFNAEPLAGPPPHVSNEVGVIKPPLTNLNASVHVLTRPILERIEASPFHSAPNVVFWSMFSDSTITVSHWKARNDFTPKTTTRFCVPSSKISSSHNLFDPAITSTNPLYQDSVFDWSNCNKSSVSFPRNVNHLSHFLIV